MVATMPVIATTSARLEEPWRPRTKSAGVTKPRTCATDHMRIAASRATG